MDIVNKLEKFLLAEVASDSGKESINPDEDLLTQGIIDSLGIMKLITFIQVNFSIKVADEDVVPENFQSLMSIEKFIKEKQS